jgi:hypothetical protein
MVEGSPEKTTSPEPRTILLIEDEPSVGSINQRHRDEALDDSDVAVPSDSTDDTWIKSNCSLELSLELEPSRTSASNSGSFESRLGMWF